MWRLGRWTGINGLTQSDNLNHRVTIAQRDSAGDTDTGRADSATDSHASARANAGRTARGFYLQ